MLARTSPRSNPDKLAAQLVSWGAMARSLPPAFRAHGISSPIHGSLRGETCAQPFGRVCDGFGLYLNQDLESLGIHAPDGLPNVYERTPIARLEEAILDSGGAITTYDGIINAIGNGNQYSLLWSKLSATTVANAWSSLFRSAGGIPAAGTYVAIPGGAAPDETNVGALSLGLPNTSSNDAYLISFGAVAAQQINMYLLADLCVAAGSISTNINTSQTVNSTALTRYTSGAGVYMSYEVTTALGATASNLTVTYTNSGGTGSRSSGAQAMTTSAIVQRMQPVASGIVCPLQSGDSGVQSVQSVILSTAMGAGVVALNLYRPLLYMPGITANVFGLVNATTAISAMLQIQAASNVLGCLVLYCLPNTTSTGVVTIAMSAVYG
jgi:hypothetical protein